MDGSDLIALISAITAIAAVVLAASSWKLANKTLVHQTLVDLQKEYRSTQMLYAIKTLWDFYNENGQDKFVEKYEEIRCEEQKMVSSLEKQKQIEAEQSTLHNQRRIVSHFYQQLANLYVNKVLTKDVVYRSWSEADLRIIPQVIVPIENNLRKVLHKPPLGRPLDENHSLLVLYRDSRNYR